MKTGRPLDGLVVLEFSQYLAGPSAGLRLADMGARVIKIERPSVGDAGRKLAIKDQWIDGSSLLFHTINRNKESFAADLKNKADLEKVKQLIGKADVMTHNFRPGVMDAMGLDYGSVKKIHPGIIYGEITGYGKRGPWKDKPGQDLLIQSLSGLAFTTGNGGDSPVPFGLAIADMICGAHFVQGILAALIRKQKTGKGALVEVSLMESILDFQFELLTTYYAGGKLHRSRVNNGHPLLSAPYGIYRTRDGFLALAMMPLAKLRTALGCDALSRYNEQDVFQKRDEIKGLIATFLLQEDTETWMSKLVEQDVWAMPVLNWRELFDHEGYKGLMMEQEVVSAIGKKFVTTRCPIRFDGKLMLSPRPAPMVGEHNEAIWDSLSK